MNGLIEQTYLSTRSDYGRDAVVNWTYPIKISTVIFFNCMGYSDVSSKLLQYSINDINLSSNLIEGHFFGYNASTPVNRYGFIIKGY